MVAIPTTCIVLPTPYALPPSMISMAVIPPVSATSTFAVACLPVTELPMDTNFAL